ncbi:zinc finger BED domain-containing protein 5-like [Octopus sinensis]|uniref:Zinc finger BED domain-containing protein 5-like n=1 Tax=Octopus sinensis TaxID=2607531 RepID=A0A6P7U111_9MOLL|nr:zinc finger BED domain-containing protein 5-like [Octopus sinensis]
MSKELKFHSKDQMENISAPIVFWTHSGINSVKLKRSNLLFHEGPVKKLDFWHLLDESFVGDNAEEVEKVSYLVARCGEAHTIAENLIKPCSKKIIECIYGEQMSKKLDLVPLSNNTISRRIQELSKNIETQLLIRLNNSNGFAIQIDESTDVEGLAVLLVFVRYPFDDIIEEDMLMSESLESNTIKNYFFAKNINWNKCVDVCSDGAKCMIGKISGFVPRFSIYTSTKTKYRNKLNASADMRIQLSTITPNVTQLCYDKKLPQCSH